MSKFFETACRPDVAAGAIAQYLRVKTPGALALAGASDPMIGTMENPCLEAGAATVRLRNAQGTRKMVADGAITAGNPVYAGASGKVSASGTVVEGRAMETVTADGDILEVMPASNTDVSTATTGTSAVGFTVDNDSATPKIKLLAQAAGTGNYTTTLKPESVLSGDNAIIVPESDGDVLAAVALAQTLTNKTLTSPVIGTGLTASGSAANDFSGSTGTFKTSTGLNTLGGYAGLKTNATPVAAAGSAVGSAAALNSANFQKVSSDSAAKGVVLPTGVAGQFQIIENTSSTACEIYAASGGTVNGGSPDASITIPASKGVLCICFAADTWIVYDLPAKAS